MQQVPIRIVCVMVTSGTQGARGIAPETKLALTANFAIFLPPLVLVLPGCAIVASFATPPIRARWTQHGRCRAWYERRYRRRM